MPLITTNFTVELLHKIAVIKQVGQGIGNGFLLGPDKKKTQLLHQQHILINIAGGPKQGFQEAKFIG